MRNIKLGRFVKTTDWLLMRVQSSLFNSKLLLKTQGNSERNKRAKGRCGDGDETDSIWNVVVTLNFLLN